jgi:hypothetical protein
MERRVALVATPWPALRRAKRLHYGDFFLKTSSQLVPLGGLIALLAGLLAAVTAGADVPKSERATPSDSPVTASPGRPGVVIPGADDRRAVRCDFLPRCVPA